MAGLSHGALADAAQHSYLVFFDFARADLTPESTKIVDDAAANAIAGKTTQIDVTGYTDTVGSDAFNLRLSKRRALTVQDELMKQGIPAGEIAIFAKGKHDLLVPTKDGVKEPQNRRVQIVYEGAVGPVAAAPAPAAAAEPCTPESDPYKNFACLDTVLGTNIWDRFLKYQELEMGQAAGPADPNAPSSHREGWPATPETSPPMPFTEWPYGGATSLGVTVPGSVDSPLMTAIANTSLGEWMNNNGFQLYGWVDPGVNVSSNTTRPGGNAPIAYIYTPNTVQLDQFVVYLDKFPDTVQTDHIDWGMRLSGIYGENYRYTTSYGVASYQLLKKNDVYGYDFPMEWGELYIPYVADGLLLRLGRYISVPDIEAQLGPNNYMYTHSMTYTFDNYTNEGLAATLAIRKNLLLTLAVSVGTEAAAWHLGNNIPNLYLASGHADPLYPGKTFPKDPGAQPSFTACIRYTWNDGKDNFYPCADAENGGQWGYNNIQWYGFTYYHKFNDQWHIDFEVYDNYIDGAPNANNPQAAAIYAGGGTPMSPQYVPFNGPTPVSCHSSVGLRCQARVEGMVSYLNYQITPLDNLSFRPEYFHDSEGWRTGTRAAYLNFGFGWQHWISPQIYIRPEIDWDRSINAKAFNGNADAGIPGNKNYTVLGAMDLIAHF